MTMNEPDSLTMMKGLFEQTHQSPSRKYRGLGLQVFSLPSD